MSTSNFSCAKEMWAYVSVFSVLTQSFHVACMMFTICLGCDSTHMQAIVQKRVINVKHDFWQIQLTNKNTAYLIFRTKNFIGVRYDAFVRSILVMAHFVKPSQGAFLFIIAMPRVEHHGRSVLNAWWVFSSWTNVSIDGCQGCQEWQQNVNGLNKNTQQNGSESGFVGIQDSVH